MKKVFACIGYWFVQLTWGIFMNIIGAIVTLFCLIFLKGKPHKNGFGVITEVFGNWGGLELGAFSLCGNYSKDSPDFFKEVRSHEFGHSIQNMFFGPFFPFIVSIPSACRYWYQRIAISKGKVFDDDWYDSVWIEGYATRTGTKVINWIEAN